MNVKAAVDSPPGDKMLPNSVALLWTAREGAPPMASFKYVVLGGGVAAGYAAREFVALGVGPGEVAIVSSEKVAPYERPALSKGYLFGEKPARLPGFHTCVGTGGEAQRPEWYEKHGIALLLDTTVVAADVKTKMLTTSKGATITFEKLIIATGASSISLADFKTPGADAQGIFYLRDEADAEALCAAIKEKKGAKAVVVGGGYIGMEVGAALSLNGLDITVVFPEPFVMPRLFVPEIAEYYEAFYGHRGVKLHKGRVVSAFKESDCQCVKYVSLNDGEQLPADLVVVGVGARPNVKLFSGQLELEAGGIKVDTFMRSSVNDVYAVGDVATFPLKLYGSNRRVEHVDNARKSVIQAVQAIRAEEKGETVPPYDYLPYFYSRVFSLSWVFYGDNIGDAVVWGKEATSAEKGGKFGAYWVKEGRVWGAFLESGSPEENRAMAEVARRQPASPGLEELQRAGVSFAVNVAQN